jgi:hypothetical protein
MVLLAALLALALWALAGDVGQAYGDVLVGDSTLAPARDTDPAGSAEAFRATAATSGTLDTLNVYLDASSNATSVRIGLYTDAGGHPGALVTQATITSPQPGAWNAVGVTATPVSATTVYWIAMLGTGGTLAFRDHCCGGGTAAENSAQTTLTSLPATWSSGTRWSDGTASVYGSSGGAGTQPPPPTAGDVGQWSPVMDWGFVAAHSILMTNGKLLLMDGWVASNPSNVFDPTTNAMTPVTNPFGLDIFCSGHATLQDGRIVIAGGHGFSGTIGIDDTSIFDPATGSWTRGPKMRYARWYPTVTELGDGRLVAISGNITTTTWADTPEIYDPATNGWSTISGISTPEVHEEEYPLTYLLPDGRLFVIASSASKSYVMDPTAPSWGPLGGSTAVPNGSAVMYRPGKILYSGGGGPLDSSAAAQKNAQRIDLTSSSPAWQSTSPMLTARYAHTLTMLPDGKVLAVGGGSNLDQQDVAGGTLASEEWDPTTGTWTSLASAAVPRVYHSTAVLLPDGRVLVAGGGEAEGTASPAERNAQFYSPPYLFKGARPTITSVPSTSGYGATIKVDTPDAGAIASVALVSLGADTHTLDMNQHFVPLSFTTGTGSLNVTLPASSSVAPPGTYMLFIVNGNGVPSVAPFLRLVPSSATPPTVSITAPASGQQVSGTSVTLTATGSSDVTSVQFTVDGAAVGPKLTSAPYSTRWDTTAVTNGTHTISATATNAAGVSAAAAPVTVTVNNVSSGGATVDAQTSKDGRGTLTTSAFSTAQAGDVLVAFATSDGPGSSAQTMTVSGAGLSWTLVKRVNAQKGTTEIWTAKAAGALTNATVTSTPAKSGYDQSLTVVAFAGSSGLGASATASASNGAPTVSLTTTRAGSLVYGAGNDYDNAVGRVVGAGQALVHQWVDTGVGDTFWTQYRTLPVASAGTTATINDTSPTGDRWNLAAVEILSS